MFAINRRAPGDRRSLEPDAPFHGIAVGTAEIGLGNLAVGQQILRPALINNPAAAHHIGPVGDAQRRAGVLFNQQNCSAGIAQALDLLEHLLNDQWRKTERRLIEQKELRRRHQAAGDRQHLLLAAAHGPRRLPPPLLQDRKTDVLLGQAMPVLRARRGHERTDQQVLLNRHRPEQLTPFRDEADAEPNDLLGAQLADVVSVEREAPGLSRQQSQYAVEKRALAGTVGAKNADELALADRECHVVQHLGSAIAAADLFECQRGHAAIPR